MQKPIGAYTASGTVPSEKGRLALPSDELGNITTTDATMDANQI
jgi:hypothetical protein